MDSNLIEMLLDNLTKKTEASKINWNTIRHTCDPYIIRMIQYYSGVNYRFIDHFASYYYPVKKGKIMLLYEISVDAPAEYREPPLLHLLMQISEDTNFYEINLNKHLYRKLEDLHDAIVTGGKVGMDLNENQEKIIRKFILDVIGDTTKS